jgi:hypothetical protein
VSRRAGVGVTTTQDPQLHNNTAAMAATILETTGNRGEATPLSSISTRRPLSLVLGTILVKGASATYDNLRRSPL